MVEPGNHNEALNSYKVFAEVASVKLENMAKVIDQMTQRCRERDMQQQIDHDRVMKLEVEIAQLKGERNRAQSESRILDGILGMASLYMAFRTLMGP